MLTLERVRRESGAFGTVGRLGIATLAFALLVELVAHLEASDHALHGHVHSATAHAAHLGVFVGMVLIIAGVIGDGVRAARLHRSVEHNHKGVA